MKRLAGLLFAVPIVLLIALLTSGCQIIQVAQPASVVAGDSLTLGILVQDPFPPGDSTHNNERFVLCCMVPNDWTFMHAEYIVVEDNGTYRGAGVGADTNAIYKWADSAAFYIPPPAGMKWVGLTSNHAHYYTDTILVEGAIMFKAGTTTGTFPLGYLISMNDAGSFGDFANFYTDTTMGQYITVEPAVSVTEQSLGGLPAAYGLSQNYPNPFNPSTVIQYAIKERSFVTLGVYDIQGRLVEMLASGERAPGEYRLTFTARGLPSGMYLVRLQAGSFTDTRKMVLMK